MKPRPKLGGQRKAVIDAAPLFNVLCLNFVQGLERQKRQNILDCGLSEFLKQHPAKRKSYFDFLGAVTSWLTTSHVIGELGGLQRSRLGLKGQDLRSFWLRSMELFRTRSLDERLVRLLDLQNTMETREATCIYGPADAGLVDLARREGAVLFTEDRPLVGQLGNEMVRCQLLQEVEL